MPSWSPDGTQLVFHTYENPQTIVVMNADGSGRETILNHWGSPRWSPKGNRIATIQMNGRIAIYDLATGAEHTIFGGPYSLWQGFSISPDGLRFCFGDTNGGVGLATLDERTMRTKFHWIANSGSCRAELPGHLMASKSFSVIDPTARSFISCTCSMWSRASHPFGSPARIPN